MLDVRSLEWLVLLAGLAVSGLAAAWLAWRSLKVFQGKHHGSDAEKTCGSSDLVSANADEDTGSNWSSIVSRGVLFAIIWWALTDGAAASWWIGAPVVLLTVCISMALLRPANLVWLELLRFAPFFLLRSMLGGVDVARRAFHPRMPLAPDLIEYPLRLPPGLPRIIMANTVSLLPGSLSVVLDRRVLLVHVLDGRTGVSADLAEVEQGVARLFGIHLQKMTGGGE